MRGRFEIREMTNLLHTPEGWQEVTVMDTVTGNLAKGLAKTYEEALQQAWRRLKELEAASFGQGPLQSRDRLCESR